MHYSKFRPENYSDKELKDIVNQRGGELSLELAERFERLKSSTRKFLGVTLDAQGYTVAAPQELGYNAFTSVAFNEMMIEDLNILSELINDALHRKHNPQYDEE